MNDQSFEDANHYLDNVMSLNMSDRKLQDTIESRNTVQNKIDHLADLLIENAIDRSMYKKKHAELSRTHSDLTVEIDIQRKNDDVTLIKEIKTMLCISKNAYSVFKSSKTDLKRVLLFSLFSNCVMSGSNVKCATVLPLSIMLKRANVNEWQCLQPVANYSLLMTERH